MLRTSEDEGGHHVIGAAGHVGLARHDQEARGVVVVIFDMGAPTRRAHRFRPPVPRRAPRASPGRPVLGHVAGSAGIVGADAALDVRASRRKPRALRQAGQGGSTPSLTSASCAPGRPSRLICTRTKASSTICSPAFRQQTVNIGDAPIGGVFHRQHRQIVGLAAAHRVDHLLEVSGRAEASRSGDVPRGRPGGNRRRALPGRRWLRVMGLTVLRQKGRFVALTTP